MDSGGGPPYESDGNARRVSLWGRNCIFSSHLGYSGRKTNIFTLKRYRFGWCVRKYPGKTKKQRRLTVELEYDLL